MKCEVCGQRVRVEGDTTKHYVGVDAEAVRERDLMIHELSEILKDLKWETRRLSDKVLSIVQNSYDRWNDNDSNNKPG